ncbi:MAG: hypothetical protein FJ121_07930 [Deltaproteobacteria bacterium]|nr:hypothetical protein [Deltaproteobacteria bacterium]
MKLETFQHRLLNLKAATFFLVITFIFYHLRTTTADLDLWGYMAFGRLFWGQGPFPYLDVFAYVPTLKPWIYHEWLTGVIFYPLYQTLGAPGLQVLKYALGLATMGTIYLTARRRGADLLPTALILGFTVAGLSLGYSAVRAQVFTYFFFALFLYLLETARLSANWRGLWLLAPIQIVWCNLHGGFLAGLGLILLYAVGELLSRRPFWPYLGWFVLAGLATLINPYGLQYWSYLALAVTMPRPEITEWVSIFAGYQHGILEGREFIHFLGLIAVALCLARLARWREITPALVLLFTLYLAVKHNRHRIFFTITFGAYMPVLLTAYFRDLSARPGFMAFLHRLGRRIPALMLILLTGFYAYKFASVNPLNLEVPSEPSLVSKNEPYYPVGAIAYIEQRQLSGKLLVNFDWGEYCLWRLYPQCLVAIDGRYETVYPESVHKEYFDFLMGRKEWRNFLEHYPPDLILIDLRSRVYGLLSGDPEWRQVYADPGCALFRRRPKPAADL